jgi:hypothetical protein
MLTGNGKKRLLVVIVVFALGGAMMGVRQLNAATVIIHDDPGTSKHVRKAKEQCTEDVNAADGTLGGSTSSQPLGNVWLLNPTGYVTVTSSSDCNVIYIQYHSSDDNDGVSDIYVDDMNNPVVRIDTYARGTWYVEIRDLSNTIHTVKVHASGNSDMTGVIVSPHHGSASLGDNSVWYFCFGDGALTAADLTITRTSGGYTDPYPAKFRYICGSSVEVKAIPDVNYALDHWTVDVNDVNSANPISVVMDSNHTLHAVFTDFTYDLTITATPNGTTDPPPETYIYAANSVAEVNAIPDECYEFDHWTVDVNDVNSANPVSVVMDSNHTLEAVFVHSGDAYDLTITATSDGTTEPNVGTYSYICGSSVEVNAVPDPNYVLDHWERDGNDVGSDNPYAVLMDSNHTLHAVFLRDADLNRNCHVDWSDLGIFGDWWLASDCYELNWCDGADLDESNDVDWVDFDIFACQWLKCITDCTCTDVDGDGYANPASVCCLFPELDCNDNDPNINAGAEEICDDSIDNDCDGLTDYADPDCGPECWKCPRQCHGDADCLAQGMMQYWVSTNDLAILIAAWNTTYPDPNYDACADFDRDGYVDSNDEDILDTWWQVVGVPPNCPPGGTWPPW